MGDKKSRCNDIFVNAEFFWRLYVCDIPSAIVVMLKLAVWTTIFTYISFLIAKNSVMWYILIMVSILLNYNLNDE